MDEAVYRMLGLCLRAGRLLSGNEQVAEGLKNIKAPKQYLLIITEDSSPRTKEEYRRAAERARISCKIFGNKERLGDALGKGVRTAALIADKGFAKAIAEKIDKAMAAKE